MSGLRCADGLHVFRVGLRKVYARSDFRRQDFTAILKAPRAALKRSRKSCVHQVGDYSVKESRARFGAGWLKHTFQRGRSRRAWFAAHHLARHGVHVPPPVAFAEKRFLGLILGHMMISEHLEGYRNVEQFLLAPVERGAGPDTVSAFLQDLADAVNRLCACGAYHADLSGKNILTRDGRHFYFIDLDAVILNAEYDDEKRMQNHIQLYDSFCDMLTDTMLVPFITRMLTPQHDPRVWMPRVRAGQEKRRLRVEKKWAREGKLIS